MLRTIVVPLDGSKRAEAIMPHVMELAICMNCRVVLMTVVEPVMMPVTSEVIMYAEDLVQHKHEMQIYLETVARILLDNGIEVETCVCLGQPTPEIINTAKRVNADMIAMSSHGRTGLSNVFYGSVAVGVLHQADRPLLLVRATGPD